MNPPARLVSEDRRQDREGFLAQLTRHYAAIRRHLIILVGDLGDAEDLMQETALVLWDRFETHDPDASFLAWAKGVATNLARNFLRKRYRNPRKQVGFTPGALASLAKVSEGAAELFELRLEKLEDCLAKLSERDRRMVWECYGNGTKIVAFASRHDKSAGTVRSRLHRLRERLHDCISRKMREIDVGGLT
ncbi:MAG: sigma-70 family RNA polymerase sigma factor [Planctomycetota bacterium]